MTYRQSFIIRNVRRHDHRRRGAVDDMAADVASRKNTMDALGKVSHPVEAALVLSETAVR
ncbi:MAG: hypothetical protein R3D02_11895 [Hyphomicrobiales bacterium]